MERETAMPPAGEDGATGGWLDEAHHRLHLLVDETARAIDRGDARTARWGMDELFDRTGDHFAAEERWMRNSDYPAAAAHLADHAAFLTELHQLRKELAQAGLSPRLRLWFGSRVVQWMKAHVKGMDANLDRHLKLWREAQAAALASHLPGGAAAPPAGGAHPAEAPPAADPPSATVPAPGQGEGGADQG